MDKRMEFTRGNPQEEGPKRVEKKSGRRFMLLGGIAAVLVLAVLAAVLWDPTAFDGLRRSVIYAAAEKDESGCARLYTYAAEKDSVYASVGGSLVQATARRILVLAEDGTTRYNADVKFSRAAVTVAGELAAVYDVGGREIYVLSAAGLVYRVEAEGEVFACSLTEKGALAVTMNRSGSKASVVVYSEKGEKVFGFNSADRFLMTSALSDNGKRMAAVAMGQSGGSFMSSLVIYDTDNTEPLAQCELSGGAVYEAAMLDGRWCAVGEEGLHFVASDGTPKAYYDFEGTYLRRCSLQGEDFAVLLLGRYKSGTQTRLVTVGSDGEQLAALDVDREVLSITACGRYTAVLYSDELTIYDRELTVCARLKDVSAAHTALMRADGSALLVGADAASLYLP